MNNNDFESALSNFNQDALVHLIGRIKASQLKIVLEQLFLKCEKLYYLQTEYQNVIIHLLLATLLSKISNILTI